MSWIEWHAWRFWSVENAPTKCDCDCCDKCKWKKNNGIATHFECRDVNCPCHSPAKDLTANLYFEEAYVRISSNVETVNVEREGKTYKFTLPAKESTGSVSGEEWEGWARVLGNSTNPRDTDLLVVKIGLERQKEYERGREEAVQEIYRTATVYSDGSYTLLSSYMEEKYPAMLARLKANRDI